MSVNCDLVIIRNGRSTSQVSVYNYPEHLNPFYEDDNHKRLRFWHIIKSPKDGQTRRNSFTLGGLKDMWAFKTLRLKKKSSSLGINKTSESPPPLRRDIFTNDNSYSKYDPRMRYTTAATNGMLGDNNAFQRNVPYRSSLQDMRNPQQPEQPINEIVFNRNDRYRSTIQTTQTSSSHSQSLTVPTPRRYVYRGSVTPQPVRNLEFNSDSLGMISRGSSQLSVASKNTFDDDDDDGVIMGGISGSSTLAKHQPRKKRRAPPPPIPVHQVINEQSSSAGSTPSHNPFNSQPQNSVSAKEESLKILNLTAEIESFFKSSQADDPETLDEHSSKIVNLPKQNGALLKNTVLQCREINETIKLNYDVITENEEPLFIREDHDTNKSDKKVSSITRTKIDEISHVEKIHVHVESPRSTPERIEPTGISSFRLGPNSHLPEKNITSPSIRLSNTKEIHENITESLEKPKAPIAAKTNMRKTPLLISRKLPNTSRESIQAEYNEYPAINEKNIGIIGIVEIPILDAAVIEIGLHTTEKPQQVLNHVQHKVIEDEQKKTEPFIPSIRKKNTFQTEQNILFKSNSKALASAEMQENTKFIPINTAGIKFEENISNLEKDLPTTISDLQLIISEVGKVAERFEKLETTKYSENIPQPIEALTEVNLVLPASIQKPPRRKYYVDDDGDKMYRPQPSQWIQSTLAPLEPVSPEKRRSVKEIIDSINRSQRLLGGANKEDNTVVDPNKTQRNQSESNTNAMEQNFKSLAESQREMRRMLLELDGLENAQEQKLSNKPAENFQISRETENNGNRELFKKCTIKKEASNASRESSPTSSNLDWNPVPKPKRTTKNLSPELQV